MTSSADVRDVRDPELPGRLLIVERDALIPLLRARSEADFGIVTAGCRVEGRLEKGAFSPEVNARDIAERGDRTNAQVVDELERVTGEAGAVIAGAGRLWASRGPVPGPGCRTRCLCSRG